MTLWKEVSYSVFIINHFEFLDSNNSFAPFRFMNDAVTTLTDFRFEDKFIKIYVLVRIKDPEAHILEFINTFYLELLLIIQIIRMGQSYHSFCFLFGVSYLSLEFLLTELKFFYFFCILFLCFE